METGPYIGMGNDGERAKITNSDSKAIETIRKEAGNGGGKTDDFTQFTLDDLSVMIWPEDQVGTDLD